MKFEMRLPPARKIPETSPIQMDDRLEDFKMKVIEEKPIINNKVSEYVSFLTDGLYWEEHDPCNSPFANTCHFFANCEKVENWNGQDILEAKYTCTCKTDYVDISTESYIGSIGVAETGRSCVNISEIPPEVDGSLVGMIVIIIILFIVILILSYFVHKKRTRQRNYDPRCE